jgi:hypothetical protein
VTEGTHEKRNNVTGNGVWGLKGVARNNEQGACLSSGLWPQMESVRKRRVVAFAGLSVEGLGTTAKYLCKWCPSLTLMWVYIHLRNVTIVG